MLAMRLQRTGRKGHAQYRVVVQDSRFSPTSGRVVAYLGTFNPHTKETTLDKEKATTYLKNGAQPSERLALLLKKEGVKLPKWVSLPTKKKSTIRNAEKLRRNRPAEEAEKPVASDETNPAEEAEAAGTDTASEAAEAENNETSGEVVVESTEAEEPATESAAK